MNIWPEVDLTDYERKYVRTYKTVTSRRNENTGKEEKVVMPGVLKRVYTKFLINIPDGEQFLAPVFEESIKISRRARIFGLVFSGDIFAWSIRLQNSAGTLYTINTAPNSDNRILVSSMVPGANYNIFAQVNVPPTGVDLQLGSQSFPIIIEPNWELMQNDTFIINGLCHYSSSGESATRGILGITAHVWEFPGMDASTAERLG